jgi:hypothetical protein
MMMGITGGMLLNPDLDKYHRVYYVFMLKQFYRFVFLLGGTILFYGGSLKEVMLATQVVHAAQLSSERWFRSVFLILLLMPFVLVFLMSGKPFCFFNYLWHGPLVYCFDGVGSQLS